MKARKHAVIGALLAVAIVVLSAAPSSALEIKRMKLSDGATLLVSEQHQLPMVSVAIAFDAGSRRDPKGKEGLAALTAASLTEGTKTLSAAEFNQKVDFMGSAISVDGGRDYSTASFTSLKKYARDAGLDARRFDHDLDSGRFAGDVASDKRRGTRAGVRGTPMFFINGVLGGDDVYSLEGMRAALDAAAARAKE